MTTIHERKTGKGPGSSLKQRNDVIMSLLTVSGIAFLIIYFKETLNLDTRAVKFILFTAIGIGTITQIVFLVILNKWLKPIVTFLDHPVSAEEYHQQRSHFLLLLQNAIKYPARHIFLSIAFWNGAGLLVGVTCYFFEMLVFEELIIVCNTIFVFSIFTNMMAYRYATRLVPPLVRELSKFEAAGFELPPGTVQTVHRKIMIFVGAIVLFLLLFFLQLISVSSLEHGKEVLREQAEDLGRQIAHHLAKADTIEGTFLDEMGPRYRFKGLKNIFIADEWGTILAGTETPEALQALKNFRFEGMTGKRPLFATDYIFVQSQGNLTIGICCDYQVFSLGLLNYSPWSLFFIGFMSVIALYLGRQIAQDISGSLSAMSRSMQDIAQGESDLSKRIHSDVSSVEILELSNWFNKFVIQLSFLIRHVQEVALKLNQTSDSMNSQARLFIQESQTQKNIIGEVSLSSELLINQSQEVSQLLTQVDSYASESFQSAKSGISSMDKLVEGIHLIKETSELNATVLEYLSNKSEAIQSIMSMVETIADQTRLLAFNAMIEAVSAGEHGSRFSVVAEEVRNLADNVSDAAKNIRGIIKEILVTLVNLVKSYNEEQDDIADLATKITSTNDEFAKIVDLSERTTQSIEKVIDEMDMQRRIIKNSTDTIQSMIDSTLKCIGAGNLLQQLIIEINTMVRKQDESANKFKV